MRNNYPLIAQIRHRERGNILFMVIIAIALIGLLTAALQQGNSGEGANIDDEVLLIRINEVKRHAAEIERGINYIMQNGAGESDIRFAIPTDNSTEYGDIADNPQWQVFAASGGAATYPTPPDGIQMLATPWEFFGTTAIPGAGTDRADLIALLPNVTEQFCTRINSINGQNNDQPANDGGGCILAAAADRFGTSFYDDASPNTLDEGTFTAIPGMQACVQCADNTYHFYHVIYPR